MLRLFIPFLALCVFQRAYSTPIVVLTDFPPAVPLTIHLDFVQGIDCNHVAGSIAVSATGGVPGYVFTWSDGAVGAVHTGLNADTYTIVVTDEDGKQDEISVAINDDQEAPVVDAGSPFMVSCSNSILTLAGSGPMGSNYVYQWTAENGGNLVSGESTAFPTINRVGKYVLTVTNTLNGCEATDFTTVAAQNVAPIALATGDTLSCSETTVKIIGNYNAFHTTIFWQGPNGFVSGMSQPTVGVPGNYFFTVTDTATGCATTAKALVLLDTLSPSVSIAPSGTLSCQQTSVQLVATVSGNLKYSWAGPLSYTSSLQSPTVFSAGTYVLVATSLKNGCTAVRSLQVTGSQALPTAVATVSGTLTCTIASVTLNGSSNTPGATFSWTGPNGFTAGTPNTAATVPGIYTLTVKNNANGCMSTTTVTVQQNRILPTASATGGNKTCANPTVVLTATANVAATYSWSGPAGFSSSQQNPPVSNVGTYSVTVTNPQNGCTTTALANVSQNITTPTLVTTGGTVTCTLPQVSLKAISTTSGISYSWSGPSGFTSTQASPLVATVGYYYVTITNPQNGCTNSSFAYVYKNNTVPNAYAGENRTLNCYFTSVVINPIGTSTGSQFSYAWSTEEGHIISGANSFQPRIDGVGTYQLLVTNTQNGCTATDEMELTQSPAVTAAISQTQNISCNGGTNGSATVVAGGGNPAYVYAWPNGATSTSLTGLGAGIYKVTVTDNDGCKATATATITEPPVLAATVTATAQTLPNVNNGTATAVASGGTAPYTVKWNTNQVTFTIQNLAPATYTVTVTDNKGCTVVRSITVNQSNCNLTGSVAVTPVTCSGLSNGTATANIVGGTNPLTYKWSNAATTKTVSNLSVGSYVVTVTDASGCPVVLTTSITSPAPLAVAIANQTNILCPGAASGTLSLNSSGGTSPYTYTWSHGATSAAVSTLSSGVYTVTVRDVNACTKTTTATIVVTDNQPPVLNLKNATVALGANNVATVTPQMFDNGSVDVGCSIVAWTVVPTTFDCSKVGNNVVTLTATDANGNSTSGTALVTVQDNVVPVLNCPANITVGACHPVVQFGNPQIVDNCVTNLENLALVQGLVSGSVFPMGTTQQKFNYVDASGNQAFCSFVVTVVSPILIEVTVETSMCSGACSGLATLQVSGGGYSAQWSNGQSGSQLTNLCGGSYTVTVQDNYGCSQTRALEVVGGDTQAPVLALHPATLSLNAIGTVVLEPAMFDAGSTDNCGIANWSFAPAAFDCASVGVQNVHISVSDVSGNTADQFVQVTVQDPIAPQIQCPPSQSLPYCQPVASYELPVVNDNCTINPAALQRISGLASGATFPGNSTTTQTFQYTDAAGNSAQCSFSISVPPAPVVQIVPTFVSCSGACDGQVIINVSTNDDNSSILWNTGQVGTLITNLCPGFYSATFTDAEGCSVVRSTNVLQPAVLNITVDALQSPATGLNNGAIGVTVSGGTAPYTFSWKRNGVVYSAVEDLSSLPGGQYSLLVTDAHGCTSSSAALTLSGGSVRTTEPDWAQGLRLQPNPARDQVIVTWSTPLDEIFEINIFDIAGRQVQQQQAERNATAIQLDLAGLAPGIWIVQLRASNGQVALRQLVIER